MEFFVLLLIIAIAALVKSFRLVRDHFRRLEKRVTALELITAELPAAPATPPAHEPIPLTVGPIPLATVPLETPAEEAPLPPERELPIGAFSPITPSPAAPPAPRASLEEQLGTQWAVWVGGLAVVLGGIFLLRYSIEQGLLGPGVRVTLGALLALALIVAGEWTRRSERLSGIAGLPTAHIPSILTAAGTTVAYADV